MVVPAETLEIFGPRQTARPFLQTASIEFIDWEAIHADREPVHWLMELLERYHAASVFYRRALSQLDEIVEMIDKEIGSSEHNTK